MSLNLIIKISDEGGKKMTIADEVRLAQFTWNPPKLYPQSVYVEILQHLLQKCRKLNFLMQTFFLAILCFQMSLNLNLSYLVAHF